MKQKRYPRVLDALMVLSVLAVAGCGSDRPPTYRAGGTVQFSDGAPLAGGWIEFQPADAPDSASARGKIQPDGTFRLGTYEPADGALAGRHRVVIVPPTPAVDIDSIEQIPLVLHPRYRQFESSGLEFTIQEDAARNEFQIVVERP